MPRCKLDIKSTYRFKNSIWKIIILCLKFSSWASAQPLCSTRVVTLGTCTLIKDCDQLVALGSDLTFKQFLEDYGNCGRDGNGNVRVCCPRSEPPALRGGVFEQSSTNKPTVVATSTEGVLTDATPSNLPTVSTVADGQAQSKVRCSPPFSAIDAENCLFFSNNYIGWEESLQMCQSLGADLYVAPNPQSFLKLKDYLNDYKVTDHQWVGVKNQKWTNGRDVDPEEWRTGEPNGANECGLMGYNGSPQSFYLYDYPCNSEALAICSKNII